MNEERNGKSEDLDVTMLPTWNRRHNDVTMHDDTSRVDAIAKVTGKAKYGIDHLEQSPLLAAFVRCPWGAARLNRAKVDAAKAVPGIVHVTLDEPGAKDYSYHGQNLGYLVAENVHALRRGLRALDLRWRLESTTSNIDEARESEPELSGGDKERVETALSEADHVVDAVYESQVQTHSSLETHGGRVDYLGDRAVVYGSTQSNYGFRNDVANTLGLPQNAVEMHCEYVGGGFGSKFGAGKEGDLAARVSKQFNRPCAVFVNREEEHLDTGNRPSSKQHFRMGCSRDGRILGGSRQSMGGVGVGGRGGGVSGVRYRFGDFATAHKDVGFNGGAPRAMRAPGHPQAMFAVELLMDELANGIGMDPLEFRRVNEPSEHRRRMYDIGAKAIGWSDRQATGSQNGVMRVGYGMGVTDWPHIQTGAEAEVVIHSDGSIESRSGTQDIGQGHRTVVAVVAATQLGVPLNYVQGLVGTTAYPEGPASGGSMTAPNTSPAIMEAADDAKNQLLAKVAEEMNVEAGDLSVEGGVIIRDGAEVMNWREACRLLTSSISGRGVFRRNERDSYHGEGHSDGVQFARVTVDTETGRVKVDTVVALQACGRVVSRKTAESQVIGGVIQGVSFCLYENKLLDRRNAAMVNANLEQYKIAGAVDVPTIIPVLWEDGGTGVRSLGEPPVIATPGAVACAIYNAIGAPVRSMPITPDKVLAALESQNGGA